jgi:hypothetical protein
VGLGLARVIFFESVAARPLVRRPRIDARYAPLRPLLTGNEPLGFLTDERFENPLESERYTQALYGLAPRQLLLDGSDAGLWVADLLDPASLSRVAGERGLEPTAILDEGRLALLRRRTDP